MDINIESRSLRACFSRIHRAYRRCASYDRRHRIDCLCSVTEVKHGSPPIAAQAFISAFSVSSVGTTYKRTTSYKLYVHYTNIKTPTFTINSSLYHSKYRMNLKNVLLALLVLSKTFSNFASNNNASSLWQIILYGRTTTGCC